MGAFLQYAGVVYRDPESLEETPLVPGMTPTENSLRWGFINKVFGIVGCQLALTAVRLCARKSTTQIEVDAGRWLLTWWRCRLVPRLAQVVSTHRACCVQVVAAVIMFNHPVQHFVLENVAVQIVFALLPFVGESTAHIRQLHQTCIPLPTAAVDSVCVSLQS